MPFLFNISQFFCIFYIMIAYYEPKERMPLVLKGYSIKDHHYDHYDNYDAINVDRAVDIPIDYDGVIGVPITILNYLWEDGLIHCVYTNETMPKMKKATPKSDFYIECLEKNLIFLSGNQFEIVGQLNVGCFMDENGWQGSKGKHMLMVNGKDVYKRILIRKCV